MSERFDDWDADSFAVSDIASDCDFENEFSAALQTRYDGASVHSERAGPSFVFVLSDFDKINDSGLMEFVFEWLRSNGIDSAIGMETMIDDDGATLKLIHVTPISITRSICKKVWKTLVAWGWVIFMLALAIVCGYFSYAGIETDERAQCLATGASALINGCILDKPFDG